REDDPGEDEDEDVRVGDAVGARRMGRRRQESARPGSRCARGEKRAERRHYTNKGSPTHSGWHRIKGGEPLAGWPAVAHSAAVRGVRERRAAGPGHRLRGRRLDAPLPTRPRPRRQAWLLALALD